MDYRLRLELYDRRWDVYAAVEQFVAQILTDLAPGPEQIAELYRSTAHARFLFGSDINDYLKELVSHAVELYKWNGVLERRRDGSPDSEDDLTEAAKGKTAETRWFIDQQTTLPERFMRYMGLSHAGAGMPERFVRIYQKQDNGTIHDTGETIDVEAEFGGSIPRVGDFIVSRWVRNGSEEARLWSNRTVCRIEAVYYRPDKATENATDSWVVLVVSERQMKEEEAGLL